ncbi:MAG TPA: molybdopterin cofactor-binding domain-containing protein [Thermodesulfobacteriota bacterium]|nr:molybdopterin cofactor-binding domain-containing protein [Thermodesulfobacteriota bacterium]
MKKRGIGISCNTHPAGLKGGGDPSQAQIRLKPDGTLDLLVGAVDIGQGSKTILRQIAADELGVPLEAITVNNFDTDIGPMCTGTFASRVTFMDGNAVIRAAADFKKQIKEWAAEALEANPADIEMADNKVFVKGAPAKAKTMAEVGGAVNWGGQFIVGTGAFIPGAGQAFDPATGKMTAIASLAFGACVAEVEVDTETGLVEVLKLIQVYEIGKAINPLLCRGQINGGAMMGIGFALTEDFTPYYPSMEHAPDNLADYTIATAADMPREMVWDIVEVPHPNGPRGAKGFSEMTASAAPPAILSAIHNAIGVWVTDYPATPERILRALEEKKAKG